MQFAHEDVGLCLFHGSNKRMQLVYKFILINKILTNHLFSEHMWWNYASCNVKSNRLTSICSNKIIKLPKFFICGHSSHVIPITETIPIYLMHDHGILCHIYVTCLALDIWGQKYCKPLGYKPNLSILQCGFQCLILPIIKNIYYFWNSNNTKQLWTDRNR